jgi:hypothetical protein
MNALKDVLLPLIVNCFRKILILLRPKVLELITHLQTRSSLGPFPCKMRTRSLKVSLRMRVLTYVRINYLSDITAIDKTMRPEGGKNNTGK